MDEFEDHLARAGDSLSALVEGPGAAAASALETAFGDAGVSIERALSQAAQSGEVNFRRMAESLIADLARIAAEAVIAQTGLSRVGQTVNLNMSLGQGADAQSVIGATGVIATSIAAAAARGGRYA
ncbi:MAG: phage tail tape measure C-terminal domain-containing protein [Pseudomonadota bacterium]